MPPRRALAGAGHRRPGQGLAALAAALGYLALVVSKLVVIRDFGLLLAGTVALSLLAAHLVVRVLPPRIDGPAVESAAAGDLETLAHNRSSK